MYTGYKGKCTRHLNSCVFNFDNLNPLICNRLIAKSFIPMIYTLTIKSYFRV